MDVAQSLQELRAVVEQEASALRKEIDGGRRRHAVPVR